VGDPLKKTSEVDIAHRGKQNEACRHNEACGFSPPVIRLRTNIHGGFVGG
jgi:hypothetical protein